MRGKLAAGSALTAALGAGALVYAHAVEPNWLDIKQVRVTLPRLTQAFDGYRIVQFSDLHMEKWLNWSVLDEVIDAANAADADLIVITGDFVTRHIAAVSERLEKALRRLKARDGVVAVLGNHDHWGNVGAVRRAIARSGVMLITNDVYTLRRGSETLHIAGVDSMQEMRARLDLVMNCLPDESAAILLAHEPDFAYISAATRRFDLQLSGHSHGGQVRVPILMNIILPPFSHKYTIGLHRVKGMTVYTNRGLGMSGVNLRFSCRPEVTVLELEAGKRGVMSDE